MTSFYKDLLLSSHAQSSQLMGKISLATTSTTRHLNLYIGGRESGRSLDSRLTLSVEQAKALRDALIEAYPVEGTSMQASPFKLGDKVRVITDRHGMSQHGCDGTVVQTNKAGTLPVQVDFINSKKVAPTRWNVYASDDLELVSTATETGRFIVSLLEGADYKPGARPVIHTSHASASAEAERLAKAHGGTFHVLRATFEATREKPVIPSVKTAVL